MRVVTMADLIAFVESCFGNPRFSRYGPRFRQFLIEHAPTTSPAP